MIKRGCLIRDSLFFLIGSLLWYYICFQIEKCQMKITSPLYLIILLLLASCGPKKYTLESVPEQRIEFGFMNQKTGGTSTYILMDNGQLFQKSTLYGKYSEYKSVTEKEAHFIFATVDQLRQSNSNLYKIGELTHFVRLRDGVNLQEWKWDPTDANLPLDIKKLDEIFDRIFAHK
jgi:hypothetical protein